MGTRRTSEEWREAGKNLLPLDLHTDIESWEAGEDEPSERLTATTALLLDFVRYHLEHGDIKFTPTSINPIISYGPHEFIHDWWLEGAEEYLFAAAWGVRSQEVVHAHGNGEHSGGEVRQITGPDSGGSADPEA